MSEVVKMSGFSVVEVQGAGEGVEDAGGDAGKVAAFEAGVVVHTHPGQQGDLFAAQSGDAPVAAERGESCGVGRDARARVVRNSFTSLRLSMPRPYAGHRGRGRDWQYR